MKRSGRVVVALFGAVVPLDQIIGGVDLFQVIFERALYSLGRSGLVRRIAFGKKLFHSRYFEHVHQLIALGLQKCGYRAEATRLASSILEAATYFNNRLPEAFAGYERSLTSFPVEYPTACRPQAWASAAPLLLLSTTLGLSPHDGGPRSDPHLPTSFGRVALKGVPGRWGRADVEA